MPSQTIYESDEDIDRRRKELAQIEKLEESYGSPDATDDDLPEGHPDKKSGVSAEALEQQESQADGGVGAIGAAKSNTETDEPDEADDHLYTGGKKARASFRARLTSRKTMVAAGAAGAIITGVSVLSLQAPNLILNHLKEMLLDKVSSVQMRESRKYRQSAISKLKSVFTKDGRLSQQIVKEMEADGYHFKFDPNNRNQLIGITKPDGTGIIGDGIGDHVDEYMEAKHPWRTARWKTKATNAFYSYFGVSRSSVVDGDNIRAGPDGETPDPDKIVNKEMAQDIYDEDTDIKVHNAASDSTDAKKAAAEDAKNADINQASDAIGEQFEKDKQDILNNGTNVAELADNGLAAATTETGDVLSKDAINIVENTAESEGSSLGGTLKEFANPLDILDKACTLRNQTKAAIRLARVARAIKLIRYAMIFVNAADDSRVGKGNSKLIGSLMKRVTAEDKNGVSIGGSPAFGYVLKSKFSKSRNDATRSSVSVDGQLTGFMGGVNQAMDRVPGMSIGCPIAQNPIVQVGTGIIGLALGAFSDGGSEAIQQAFEQGFKEGVQQVISNITDQIVLKEVAKDALKQAVKDLSFQAIMALTSAYVQKSLALPFTGQEQGGQLGEILVAGTGAANKQRSLAAGFVPATTQQFAAANDDYIAWNTAQQKNLSFKDRMLSMNDTHSLLYNASMALSSTASSSFFTTSKNLATGLASALNPVHLFKTISSVFIPHALADSPDDISYDSYVVPSGANKGASLATDPAGNVQTIMRSDIAAIDPERNKDALIASGDIDATTLQPKSEAFIDHVDNCVKNPDVYSQLEGDDEYDCLAKNQKTKMFKAHLAYLDLLDSMNAEFFPGEITDTTVDPVTAQEAASSSTPTSTSTNKPKTSGSGSIDISQTSPIPGTNQRIATSVLPQLEQMINAAKTNGINLLPITSGWRDPQEQIALYAKNCNSAGVCHPPTAKPGTSNHEGGRAVDFGNMCYPNPTCPGNARWVWLHANAAKYGFYPLSSEAWHWSTDGK